MQEILGDYADMRANGLAMGELPYPNPRPPLPPDSYSHSLLARLLATRERPAPYSL